MTAESEKLAGKKGPFKARSGLGYHLTVRTKEHQVEEKHNSKIPKRNQQKWNTTTPRTQQTDGHEEELCLWCRCWGTLTTAAALAAVALESPSLALVAAPTATA